MTALYIPALLAHVLTAVLGLGSIAALAVVAASARRTGRALADVLPWLHSLFRYSAISLAIMLATGILLDLASNGTFRGFWWFRVSALLLIATGAIHGRARRALRRSQLGKAEIHTVLRRVERLGYAMCVLIAAITVMMEVRPF